MIDHVARVTGHRPFAIGQSMGAVALGAYLIGAVRETDASGSERVALCERTAVTRQAALRGCALIEMPAALKWPAQLYCDGRLDWRRLLGKWIGDPRSNFAFEMLSRAMWLERPLTAVGRISLERLRPKPGPDWWQRLPNSWQERSRGLYMGAVQRVLDVSSPITGASNHSAEVLHLVWRLMLDGIQAGVLRQFAKSAKAFARARL